MSFTVPTLAQLISRIASDFLTEAGIDAYIRRRTEYYYTRVLAFIAKGNYSYILERYKQAFYDTADDTEFWHHFTIFGLSRSAAVAWQGSVLFTGTPTTNIPAATAIQRSDGATYTTDALATIDGGGSISVAVTADDTGATPSCEDGTTLSLTSPISGVDSDATVEDTTTEGADQESRENAETRLGVHLSNPVQAGGPGTYEAAALAVSGVTRAWEFPGLEGVGSVSVAFARDNDVSPIPDSGERATVQTALDAMAPVTAIPVVITLTGSTLNVTISDLVPDTTEIRTAIEDSLEDLVGRKGPGDTITTSEIRDAISNAGGETSHTSVSPTADQVYATNELPIWGTLTVS